MKTFRQYLKEGYTEEGWRKLSPSEKQKYIREHPTSKYAVQNATNKISNGSSWSKATRNVDDGSSHGSKELAGKVGSSKNVTPDLFDKMIKSKDSEVRTEFLQGIRNNKNISQEVKNKYNDYITKYGKRYNIDVSDELIK